jgi:hypothetical protein
VTPLVEFIVRNPGLAERLIAEHVDDGQGYCRRCALGGQRGYFRFPCDIRRTADTARRLETQRSPDPPPDGV